MMTQTDLEDVAKVGETKPPRCTERPAMLIKLDEAIAAVEKRIPNSIYPVGGIYDEAKADAVAALRALPTVSDGWEDISSAPRDRTSILAIVAPNDSRHLEYHAGRMFVIRHEGVTDNGYDLGWAVYPGFGGAPDWYFAGWRPLPAPPSE